MRETKFRIWDLDKQMYLDEDKCYKKNICVEGEKINSIDNIFLGLDGSIWYEWHDGYEIQNQQANAIKEQYTGLKDKNGVEIYEGDIVNGWLYSNCEVKFGAYWNKEQYEDSISGYGWYIQKIGDSVLTITGLNEDSVEVIGNIHNDK